MGFPKKNYLLLQNALLLGIPAALYLLTFVILFRGIATQLSVFGAYEGYLAMVGGRSLLLLCLAFGDEPWQTALIQLLFCSAKVALFNLAYWFVVARQRFVAASIAVNTALALWCALYVATIVLTAG